MSTAVIHQQNAILQQLAHVGSVQSIEEILAALALPRRTLQRRLAELVANGKLKKIGQGCCSRYSLGNVFLMPKNWDLDVDEQEYLEAVLAVYELNNIDLLRDMFVRAYERSIQRYGAIRQSVQPDIFRLRYRKQLSTIVHSVVTERVAVARLSKFIHTWTQQNIPVADQAHFKAIVDKELAGLHEGNIARHRVQSAEFLAWKKSSLRRR